MHLSGGVHASVRWHSPLVNGPGLSGARERARLCGCPMGPTCRRRFSGLGHAWQRVWWASQGDSAHATEMNFLFIFFFSIFSQT